MCFPTERVKFRQPIVEKRRDTITPMTKNANSAMKDQIMQSFATSKSSVPDLTEVFGTTWREAKHQFMRPSMVDIEKVVSINLGQLTLKFNRAT